MNSNRDAQIKAFGRFLDVLDALRENCPWDKKQTNDSLRPNTIEEVYELCDALINDDTDNICAHDPSTEYFHQVGHEQTVCIFYSCQIRFQTYLL